MFFALTSSSHNSRAFPDHATVRPFGARFGQNQTFGDKPPFRFAYFTPSQARISRHGKPPLHGKTGRHFTHGKPTLVRVRTG